MQVQGLGVLVLVEEYQQAWIQVLEGVEVVFVYIQILKSLIDDPEVFPVIGRIPDAMLELVSLSNLVLIPYSKLIGDVPKVLTPKKTKTTSKDVLI